MHCSIILMCLSVYELQEHTLSLKRSLLDMIKVAFSVSYRFKEIEEGWYGTFEGSKNEEHWGDVGVAIEYWIGRNRSVAR